jgi:hypothetical protein
MMIRLACDELERIPSINCASVGMGPSDSSSLTLSRVGDLLGGSGN